MCENHESLLNLHVDAYYKYLNGLKYFLEIIFELSTSKSHKAPPASPPNARVFLAWFAILENFIDQETEAQVAEGACPVSGHSHENPGPLSPRPHSLPEQWGGLPSGRRRA